VRKVFFPLISSALLAASLTAHSSPSASAESTLITCTDLNNQKTVVLRANQKSCKPLHATAIWRTQQSDSTAHSGSGYASLRTCTSQRTQFEYQLLRSKCAKHQKTNDYWRTVTPLGIPIITTASARGYDSAAFALAATKQNLDAPVAYYLITNIKTGQINKVSPNNLGELSLSNLSPLTSYTFTIAAVSVDGTSLSSSITPEITTGAIPVVEVAPTTAPLAVPAFTLSSSSETATVNTSATGFTISSTGGAIATFAISATPPGMSFSTSTGALTGTPTSVASATSYTITATNASGSATRTFTLTVTTVSCANGGTCVVGNTGPGGGVIFYVANAPFMCGPTRTVACSYLEAAPSGWNAGADPARTWAQSTPANYQNVAVTGTGTGIGWGYQNTRAIIQQGNSDTATSAAALADSHTVTISGVTYDDWYLPSRDELNQMCKWARGVAWISDDTLCSGGTLNTGSAAGFVGGHYWSSSEWDANGARFQNFSSGNRNINAKDNANSVRPVRAF
jgi:hypothetical protein